MNNSNWKRKMDRKMESHNSEEWQNAQFRGKITLGFFVLLFGVGILLKKSGVWMPEWTFSGATFLIALGIITLIKHNFRKFWGWVVLIIGGVLLLNKIEPTIIETKFIFPSLIILLGLSILWKAISNKKKNPNDLFESLKDRETTGDTFFESTAIFGGVEKLVMSKDFRGAKITSVFGGNEVNFMQADMETEAIIDVNAVFGGVTLIVPSNWSVQSDTTSIFGGVEDNRPTSSDWQNEGKTLRLKGLCAFGGIEIKSYH